LTLTAKILQTLRSNSGAFCQGRKLTQGIGISRAVLWNHIEALRTHGYAIEATRAKGYRLVSSPDRPFPWELLLLMRSKLFRKNIIYRDEIESTNALAFQQAIKGTPEGTVVIADSQTGGKGRMGRSWHSPPGLNIYTSVILRPHWPPSKGAFLTITAGVAVAETLEALYGLHPQIKWPNDIMLGMKKAAGILTEMSSEQDRINFIVLGIGINVNALEKDFPQSLRGTATSVREILGRPVNRSEFVASLYDRLDECYNFLRKHSLIGIKERWESRSVLMGKLVQASGPGRVVTGLATALDDDGALIITTGNETRERIVAGDVKLC